MGLINKYGKTLSPTKKMYGEFGSPYEYPNYGRFTPYYFVNQDHEQSVNRYIRDQLVKWSRMLTAQMPFLQAAIKTFSLFCVGNAYLPQYQGDNEKWGKEATDWLTQIFYPNACTRGIDFQSMLLVGCQTYDIDGDFGCIYGEDKNGLPQVQIIPAHRIGGINDFQKLDSMLPNPTQGSGLMKGPFPNTITTDGIVYKMDGTPIGFVVTNSDNLVNGLLGLSGQTTTQTQQFFSFKNARLIYDPRFFDKGRGLPSISSGILQGLSILELDRYITEGQKMAACTALVEETPSGEGPYDEQIAIQRLMSQANTNNTIGVGLSPLLSGGKSGQGLRMVDGPSIRYVPKGYDVKTLNNTNPSQETLAYLTRFEQQILQTIGIPHELLFSRDNVSGRMSDGVCKMFNNAVSYRQSLIDKHAKFTIAWAVSKAIQNGFLPPNDEENLLEIFTLTHPSVLSLNESYDRQDDLTYFQNGLKTMNEITMKQNRKSEDVLKDIEKEQIQFFASVKNISQITGVPMELVISSMRESVQSKIKPLTQNNQPTFNNGN